MKDHSYICTNIFEYGRRFCCLENYNFWDGHVSGLEILHKDYTDKITPPFYLGTGFSVCPMVFPYYF